MTLLFVVVAGASSTLDAADQPVTKGPFLISSLKKRVQGADIGGYDVVVLPADAALPKRGGRPDGQVRLARWNPAVAFDAEVVQKASDAGVVVIASARPGSQPRFDTQSPGWVDFAARVAAGRCLAAGFDGWAVDGSALDRDKELKPLLLAMRAAHTVQPIYVMNEPGLTRVGSPGVGLYLEYPLAEQSKWMETVSSARAGRIPVLSVVKAQASDGLEAINSAADQLADAGAVALVTSAGLDGVSFAPLRERPRKVMVVFGWDPAEAEKPLIPETDTMTAELFQAPLEWLGYEADYANVAAPGKIWEADASYAAVFLDAELEIPARKEPEFVAWLANMKALRVPIMILGSMPFSQEDSYATLREVFGFQGTLSAVTKPREPELTTVDPRLMNSEVPVVARVTGFRDLQAPPNAHVLVGERCKDEEDNFIAYTPAFLCSWGGMWCDPHIILRGSQDNYMFFGDPYKILSALMARHGPLPAPDATTQDGMRLFYSHIDGDGFGSLSNFRGHPFCAELIRDRVLKAFPLPVTVSVVQAEIQALAEGVEDEWKPKLEELARSIFALPNVSAASHSFSHPYQWDAGDPNPGIYTEPFMPLKPRAGYTKVDLNREIRGSVDYINKELLPDGKKVGIMLWSGNCRPGSEALRIVDSLGIENMNGGNTIVSRLYPGIAGVAPRVMQWNGELQIHAANQNEFMYANGWNGPFYGGFADVIDTFERTETPRRLKPVNVYYHFYSATSLSSLRALEKIHHWCMSQPLHPVTAVDYARIARDAHHAKIYELAPRQWRIGSAGDVRSFRLPVSVGRPDLAKCSGVTGWVTEAESLYVHTDGRPDVTLVVQDAPVDPPPAGTSQLHLTSSPTELEFSEFGPWKMTFRVNPLAMSPVNVVFSGLPARSNCDLTVNSTTSKLTADSMGRLSLNLPPGANVTIDAQRSRYALLR